MALPRLTLSRDPKRMKGMSASGTKPTLAAHIEQDAYPHCSSAPDAWRAPGPIDVGSLKLVGEGKWSADDLAAALAAKDRAACGPVAPARGLYLMKVDYALDA